MAERLNALWRKETLSAEEQKDIDLDGVVDGIAETMSFE